MSLADVSLGQREIQRSESAGKFPVVWCGVHLWTPGLDSPCVVEPEHFRGFHFTEVALQGMLVPLWSDMLWKCLPLLRGINASSVRVGTLGASWLGTAELGFGLLK